MRSSISDVEMMKTNAAVQRFHEETAGAGE